MSSVVTSSPPIPAFVPSSSSSSSANSAPSSTPVFSDGGGGYNIMTNDINMHNYSMAILVTKMKLVEKRFFNSLSLLL